MTTTETLFDFDAAAGDGAMVPLATYRGSVLLIVNVASRCGYTPQYKGLERLYRKYQSRGFVVLGFPTNEFGAQEPGTDEEIQEFCSAEYDVTFPIFRKTTVNGAAAHPLYRFLRSQQKGWLGSERIKWNFTKFLVDRTGRVIRRYGPADAPDAIEPEIVRALDHPV